MDASAPLDAAHAPATDDEQPASTSTLALALSASFDWRHAASAGKASLN
ncbi:MAG TPA: hypothetical protein VGF95_15900 [Solirubrobacteraceae bacterium]